MKFNKYQRLALRTTNQEAAKIYPLLGLAGECGEVIDYMKKVMYHGHEFDKKKLSSELGDILWYISVLASTYDIDLNDVAKNNIEKLAIRYPDGFSEERSKNREYPANRW